MTGRIIPGNYAGGLTIMSSVAGPPQYAISCYVKVCTGKQLRALIESLEQLAEQVEKDERADGA